MGMVFGITYVLSGLLITLAGRRNWKLKRERLHKSVQTDEDGSKDAPDQDHN
jgi:hypothetical protein